jgi:small subunit ribosomal protein S16
MVKLRLRRKGRRHLPFYDIVAIDGRKRRDGAFLERIGYYDPNERPSIININPDRAVYWLTVGAQPSHIVRKILKYDGVLLRKALMHKGKSQQEIEEAVEEHKSRATERYWRKREERKEKKLAKEKADEEAEKEAEEKPAESAEEAPAES